MKRMLAAALAGALALTLAGCGDQSAVFVSGGEPDLTLTPHALSADAEQLAAIADLDVTMADYTANLGEGDRWLRLRLMPTGTAAGSPPGPPQSPPGAG